MDVLAIEEAVRSAKASRVPQGGLNGGLPAAATRPRSFGYVGGSTLASVQSDGVATGTTYILSHKIAGPNQVDGLRVVYTNWQWDPGNLKEVDGPNAITVTAAVELPNGSGGSVLRQATFAGATSVVIPPGGMVVSDPVEAYAGSGVPVALTPGQAFRTRTYVSVATAGMKWPLSYPAMRGNSGGGTAPELGSEGALTTGDLTMTANGWIYSSAIPYGPAAILASYTGRSRVPSLGFLGDSIANGYGDTAPDMGFMPRAAGTAFGAISVATDSDQAQTFKDMSGSGGKNRWRRLRLLDGCSHVIVHYGTNDIGNGRTSAQLGADVTEIVTTLKTRGKRVYLCTVPPRSSSSDTYATVGGQTPSATNPERVAYNALVRAGSLGADGYFDTADAVESARDSGKWKVGYVRTADGIHPSATGYAAMAAVLPTGWAL